MIDWENSRGKSPTPTGGYKRNMEIVLEAAEAVISTGDMDLIAGYFKSIVMYELYGQEADHAVINDRTGDIAFRTQAKHTDTAIQKYIDKCITNYCNSKGISKEEFHERLASG